MTSIDSTSDELGVKPRKLHKAWRELKADSWKGRNNVWLLDVTTNEVWDAEGCIARFSTATHWQPKQPCDPPAVWEDEA